VDDFDCSLVNYDSDNEDDDGKLPLEMELIVEMLD